MSCSPCSFQSLKTCSTKFYKARNFSILYRIPRIKLKQSYPIVAQWPWCQQSSRYRSQQHLFSTVLDRYQQWGGGCIAQIDAAHPAAPGSNINAPPKFLDEFLRNKGVAQNLCPATNRIQKTQRMFKCGSNPCIGDKLSRISQYCKSN